MKQTINFSQFCDAFHNMDRNDNFSYKGKQALFDYLESYEEDCETETEIELDVIALCCEYSELTYDELFDQYDIDIEEYDDIEERNELIKDWLQDNTQVIEVGDDTVIIQDF